MPGETPADPGLEIEAVECTRVGGELHVRLQGRWLRRRRPPKRMELLVAEDDGQHHRFRAIREARKPRIGRPTRRWSGSFALPAWLEPRLSGRMTLSIGDALVPVPAEAILALRSELQERATAEAQLRGRLDEIQQQLQHLTSSREEIAGERDSLARELSAVRAELAASIISRDAATSAAAGLRAEVGRLGGELAHARKQSERREGLGEAEALLAQARALTASLRDR
jgi:hypothetical protein